MGRNNMKFRHIVIPLIMTAFIAGCAQDQGQKQTAGTLLGAVGGAVAGAQFGKGKGQLVGVALGTMAGAFLGSEVGRSLDNADRAIMAQSTQKTLESAPTGKTSSWQNPDTGVQGTVTPTRTYQKPETQEYCREYQQTVMIGGQEETAYGTACRKPDGSWQVVN
ncbi:MULTISPECIES: RT0821/Lpp0805 family surface protein [Thalassospira]|jgi:surface antigen|uniref:RT0821/Lpp0805 family surface protein n=1 Tax=Thalassospira TaxID=168934 RepID=UPI001FCA7389|nr:MULTISPECIES: RT0821/Lpp0805 family surface protein [Thalassospira]|tara:strand:+ start:79123 stop:79614 length:492 start_codon:yes stop_codon:yes gene_type:complete